MKHTKRVKRQNDILFILGSSFIVVVAWIGFNLYHIYITSTISEEIQVQLTPIDPSFDTKTIEDLKSRERINPAFERTAVASQSTPVIIVEPTTEEIVASSASRFAPTQTPITIQGQ